MAVNSIDRIAQTNLQLYRQLMDQEWSEEALGLVVNAYELALGLFAVQVRPNRKAFVSHLVGTASVAATQCDRVEVTSASLLHAAYTLGDWGDGKRVRTLARRIVVERAVGAAAEALVAKYTTMEWGYKTTQGYLARSGQMNEEERTLVLMRLANEAEEWNDLGLRFSAKGQYARFQPENVDAVQALARSLGFAPIADFIDRASKEHASTTVPSCFRNEASLPGRVTPQSPWLRFSVRLGSEIEKGKIVRRGARQALRRLPLSRKAVAP
jgi:hypothetical protein